MDIESLTKTRQAIQDLFFLTQTGVLDRETCRLKLNQILLDKFGSKGFTIEEFEARFNPKPIPQSPAEQIVEAQKESEPKQNKKK